MGERAREREILVSDCKGSLLVLFPAVENMDAAGGELLSFLSLVLNGCDSFSCEEAKRS